MRIAPAVLRLTASHWLWAVLVLLAAVVAVVLYYRRTVPPLRLPVRGPLIALRILAALALFLALADALWSAVTSEQRAREMIVLVDRSGSMGENDGGDPNRLARALNYTQTQIVDRFGDRAEVTTLYFDGHLLDPAVALPDSLGAATGIGEALVAVQERLSGPSVPRAVMVLSDGANNRGRDPVDAAASFRSPVIAVGFGRPGSVQARVAGIATPEVVMTGQPFAVDAVLQSGTDSGNVVLRLSVDGRTLEQQQVTVAAVGARLPVRFEGRVAAPGLHGLRIDVIGPDGQLVPAAGRSAFVRALKSRLKVLLLGFTVDWEYATLKRRLVRESRIELIDHVVGKPRWGAPFPSAAEWREVDVAIFVHPSRRELDEYWAPYAGAMSQPGKGVVFLLNDRFARAGVGRCPYPLEFCGWVSAPATGEFASEPIATRQNQPLVRLDPTADWERTRSLWTERPPWASVLAFDSLPADADPLVLATISPDYDVPVLWTRPLGRGRSLTLTAGPHWRWVAEEASAGRAPEQYDAFWQNALRWLTLADDADRLAVRSDRDVYHSGEEIALEGLVFDEAYRFLDRAEVTARVWRDTVGSDTVRLFLNPGVGDRFVARLSALEPGTYRFDGRAEFGGSTTPLAGGKFRVESYGLEAQYSGLNESLLRAIASASGTGGRYYTEHEAPTFLDSLDWQPITRERPVEFPLGNHWLVLTIFVAALSVEWFVRRRQQLL